MKQKSKMVIRGTSFAERNLIIIFLVLAVFLAFATKGTFLSFGNITNLLRQTSINGVVALAMLFVIITGGIDLSVGSVVGLSGMVFAMLTSSRLQFQFSTFQAVVIALLVSIFVGVGDGFAVHDLKVPPFIATLGMMTFVRGLVMYISSGRMITGIPYSFVNFSSENILDIPKLVWLWVVMAVIVTIVLKYTKFGRNLYALGSNKEAARLSGISLRLNYYGAYAVSGLLSGIAGIMLASRLAAGVPTAGQGYELDAIASVVIGGASLSGGTGTALGTVIGALLIQTLRNGGNLLGIDPFVMQMAIGLIIIAAVFFDQYVKARRG
ncbi:ABC transporter permease [Pseudothermotoga lettingae]|uniref:Monosaccharide-transporting ATPase n=1 Tax=Pseudothermotoga lettingae (strain ATCC BAA-301 / DSM 14385 / NBRC 107922 / TMO) TaxID=416591 RepID=A8F3M1_PSELT|nr:ABC transporter permease [Pseudothermotoga lettingae]ABV32755.1 Monosaccharide-transporting ATPase [Pseudothermotoga lettingae TMO]GLI48251.1 sugar ABC transporter permease [Pseudothermotoga lettingae TMO]